MGGGIDCRRVRRPGSVGIDVLGCRPDRCDVPRCQPDERETFKGWVVNVDIDALIDRVVINGVDVTSYVNEHDRWFPVRSNLRAPDPEGMRAAWAALDDAWATTIDQARQLPEEKLHESVNGEWSFVQTLRHLVFATDKWFTVPVLGEGFHPMVLPNSGSDGLDWPGRDRSLPSRPSPRRSRCGPGEPRASASTSRR